MFVKVTNGAFHDCERIAEGNMRLLLDQGISVARGPVELKNGCTSVLLCKEGRHLPKDTTIAFIKEAADVTHLATLGTAPPDSVTTDMVLRVEINRNLSATQNDALMSLLRDFSDCFATTSKVRQTRVAKHRIINDECARPVRQHP